MARPVVVLCALLFATSARAQPAVDWSKAQTVVLLMVDDRFEPDHLSFQHGVPYRLHMANHGKDLHEFTAPEFLADALVRDQRVLANGGKEVVVQPGAEVEVYLVPMKAGTFRLICADHDWDGMVGEITVE
ncbi:MAG TPA: cupredoxin domain-containing protein [Acetobacteraceae bacterium]